MKKILLLGPFPVGDKGLNGQTIANQTLYDGLKDKYNVKKINTAKNLEFTDKKDQGKFKTGKFLRILFNMIAEIFHMLFNKYDVVYITPGQSFLGFMRFSPYMLIAFLKKESCYIHIHGGFFRKMYDGLSLRKQKIINYFLKRITGAIVLGQSLKNMFVNLVPENKIFVCENGVQDYVIATKQEIENKINRVNKTKKRKVLYLSNLMKEKGILEVLKVSEMFTSDEIEFNLAGAIEPGLKETINDYLKKYPKKIVYHGVVNGETKKRLLLENDIFILPTYYTNEGQPISILEAYVTGCSVVTTNQGGICDTFEDDVNGCLCQAKDVDSIYKAIKRSLNDNSFIERNYHYGIENYTSDKFVERIEKIIMEENLDMGKQECDY